MILLRYLNLKGFNMTTVYTIYAEESPVYQGTNYTHIKRLWDEVISSIKAANGLGTYTLYKGEELMFEYRGITNGGS